MDKDAMFRQKMKVDDDIYKWDSPYTKHSETIRQIRTAGYTLNKRYALQINMYNQMLKKNEGDMANDIRTMEPSYLDKYKEIQ